MIFAETNRLLLRQLEKRDLPRLTELIGDWDVAKWLIQVPHPYTLKDAEDWFDKTAPDYRSGRPSYFLITDKKDDTLMGAAGLHVPRVKNPEPGEVVLGYWLGKPFWGQGFMTEAAKAALRLGFARPDVKVVTASTDPANTASQRVLYKASFAYLGIHPRLEEALRGSPDVTCWALPRTAYERMKDGKKETPS